MHAVTMAYVPLEELLKDGDSLYKLVLLASKRALELSQGAPPLVKILAVQPSTIALEEIRQGQVSYRVPEEPKETKKKSRSKGA